MVFLLLAINMEFELFCTKETFNRMKLKISFFLPLIFVAFSSFSQERLAFLEVPDSLHQGRFWTCLAAGTTIYTGLSIGLYDAWYSDFELVGFHTFDDTGEWEDMDKVGHLFSAYTAANISFNGALWTGMDRKAATWTAVGVGTVIQSTIEIMDAFSAKWGFSWADIGYNTLGVGLFAGQEFLWHEQRILMKVSSSFGGYPDAPILSVDGNSTSSLRTRAGDLYGMGLGERFLKDYNQQTIWLSANIASFSPDPPAWLPKWLNIAVGYGANNMFGGFENTWMEDDATFILDESQYPRYKQFYLSFDVDLDRIKTKSRFVKSLLHVLNWIKIPSPALEITSQGNLYFHPLHY